MNLSISKTRLFFILIFFAINTYFWYHRTATERKICGIEIRIYISGVRHAVDQFKNSEIKTAEAVTGIITELDKLDQRTVACFDLNKN